MIKNDLNKMFLSISIVFYFVLSVLEILNCDYLIKYYYEYGEKKDNNQIYKKAKDFALFTKYFIIIFIIFAFILGGLLFYKKNQSKQLINKYRKIIYFVCLLFYIYILIISFLSIKISVDNIFFYNSLNKHIIYIQYFSFLFIFIVILIQIMLFVAMTQGTK